MGPRPERIKKKLGTELSGFHSHDQRDTPTDAVAAPDAPVSLRLHRDGTNATRKAFHWGAGVRARGDFMRIEQHDKSHIVELEDGSRWQIWPGDIATTLQWLPTTELQKIG